MDVVAVLFTELSKEELKCNLMTRGVEETDANILFEENVDGASFVKITNEDLKDLGFKLGNRKKILSIIETENVANCNKPSAYTVIPQVSPDDEKSVESSPNASFVSSSPFSFRILNCATYDHENMEEPHILPDVDQPAESCSSSSLVSSSPLCFPTVNYTTHTYESLEDYRRKIAEMKNRMKITEQYSSRKSQKKRVISDVGRSIDSSLSASLVSSSPNFPKLSCFVYDSPETIPILDIITSSERGKCLLSSLNSMDILGFTDINAVVRLVVARMAHDLGTLYPTTTQKVNLAKALVYHLPVLKLNRDDVEGYEHFYDPSNKCGKIEWRLKTLRLRLDPSEKRRKVSKKTHIDLLEEDPSDFDESLYCKIGWMKFEAQTELHRKEIFEAMAETFEIRRKFILREKPSVSEILLKYPRFKDYNAALIDVEFSRIYPEAVSFVENFPLEYASKIIAFVEEKRKDLEARFADVFDDNLRALLHLADLLPVIGLRKINMMNGRFMFPSDYLVRFCVTADLETVKNDSFLESSPYLVCEGDRSTSHINFFLILYHEAVAVGDSALEAFDLLQKAHYVFNVCSHKGLQNYFNFIDTIIMKVTKGPANSVVENLNNLLQRALFKYTKKI